ncbi:hypothetical protein ACH42_14635 [Endozoicomonas sp. (ex Bugula neritina AB1)]|nr:hypothetical protein ACH42_14635 [Endozoicomonas sp. (ex Bugula neritina AB1)]
MNDFLTKAESVLEQEAEKYTPKGSTVRAVVHQWLNAIAYEKTLFGEKSGVVRDHIIAKLTTRELFDSVDVLKKQLHDKVELKPKHSPKFTFIDLFAGIGGFRLALQEHGGVGVFSSEWDKSVHNTFLTLYWC